MYTPYNPYQYLYPNNMPQSTFQGQQAPFQQIGMNLPQPQQQQPSSVVPTVIPVSTIKQVEQAQVAPGGKALVLVANEPVIAMRTADNMGLTTTDYYHITKFDPDAQTQAQGGNWVTHEELQQALAQQAQQVQQAIEGLRAPTTARKTMQNKEAGAE